MKTKPLSFVVEEGRKSLDHGNKRVVVYGGSCLVNMSCTIVDVAPGTRCFQGYSLVNVEGFNRRAAPIGSRRALEKRMVASMDAAGGERPVPIYRCAAHVTCFQAFLLQYRGAGR
jgi:hypothetical protein